MPIDPPVAEELLTLLDKDPDLTLTQRALIKATAAFLVEDVLTLKGESTFDHPDPRLVMNGEEFELLPDRIELWWGIPSPKRWMTPNRLAATRRKEAD